MNKIVIACALDWVATEISKDLMKDIANRVILLTSMRKSYFVRHHPDLLNNIIISYSSIFFRKIVQYIKFNNALFMQFFYLYFDLVTTLTILRKRPQVFIGYTSMSTLSLYTCKRLHIKTYLYNGNTHMTHDISYMSKILGDKRKTLANSLKILIANIQYKIADQIIVESSYAKNSFIESKISDKKIIIVPTMIDKNIFSMDRGLPLERCRFISVGLKSRKGILILIEIWDKYGFNLRNDVELILIGKIEEGIINLVLNFIDRTDNVIYLGELGHIELAREYRKSNAFILLTYDDGGPRALVEAYYSGCFIVSTENCIAKDLPDKAKLFVSSPFNHQEIVKNMRFLIENNKNLINSKVESDFISFRSKVRPNFRTAT
jgi:hypothetical protein